MGLILGLNALAFSNVISLFATILCNANSIGSPKGVNFLHGLFVGFDVVLWVLTWLFEVLGPIKIIIGWVALTMFASTTPSLMIFLFLYQTWGFSSFLKLGLSFPLLSL